MLNTSHRLNNFIQTGDSWNPVIRMMLCIMVLAYILQFDIFIFSESMSPNQKNIISTLDSTPTVAVLGAGWWLVCNHIDLNQEL